VGDPSEGTGSNNWVISGDRTADGKPLLANDPHLDATAPGIWYLSHLSSPGQRVSGVTIPGVPGIILGHNEYIAWGATNVGPDVQDLYSETFNTEGKYLTPDGATAPVIRKEVIKVRTNLLKTDTEDVVLEVTETRNGPIVVEDGGKRFALRWTALDPANREFEAFYYLNRAKDWTEFTKALASYVGATQNFVYADVKGHIGWHAAGRIPIRRTGYGELPYDGSTNDGEWTGYIPFNDLPQLFDPPSGFIVTANQRAVGTSYKYPQYTRDYAAPWRARRIYELLENDKKVTMDRVTQIEHQFAAHVHEPSGRRFRRMKIDLIGILRGDNIHDRVQVVEMGPGGFVCERAPYIARGEQVEIVIDIGEDSYRFRAQGAWLRDRGED
jgi:penicillin amidase